jgi:transposase
MPKFELSSRERGLLLARLHSTHDEWTSRRIQALLALDDGERVATVARMVRVGRMTVYRWIREFRAPHNALFLVDRRGEGRPRVLGGQLARYLRAALNRTPLRYGFCRSEWTIPLLLEWVHYQTGQWVGQRTIQRELHAMGYVWKRARYVLEKDPQEEKKTAYPAYS